MHLAWNYRSLLILVFFIYVNGGITNNPKKLFKDDDSSETISDISSSTLYTTGMPDVPPVHDLVAKIDGSTLTVTWSYEEVTTTLSSTTEEQRTTSEVDTSSSTLTTEFMTAEPSIAEPSTAEPFMFELTTFELTTAESTTVEPTTAESTNGPTTESVDTTVFMVEWDDDEYETPNMTWVTNDYEDGDNVTVCVTVIKGDASSVKDCTDAEEIGDNDEPDLGLIIGLSIGAAVVVSLFGAVIYLKVIKPKSNRKDSDISMSQRQQKGQDNPQKTNDVLTSEFNKLQSLTSDRSTNIAKRFKDKNPYADVLPYDDTLVKLKRVEYMNASYILNKKFIVTPDPMPDQDNDIWQLIYECDVRVIVKISAGGEQKPMAQYIPDHAGDSWVMGADEVDINLQSSQQWDGYAENTLKLKKNGDSRELKHFHLSNWPEGSAQSQKDQAKVLRLISSGRNFLKKPGNGKTPILIHCGAGSGRAGTLTGIWHLMDQHDKGEIVNTYKCVEAMRKDRVSMVQNQEQYNFMYHCITEYQNQSHVYRGNENEYGEYEQ